MIAIQCDTSRFQAGARNGFKCNACSLFANFGRDCTEVIILAFGKFSVVRDGRTGALLHDCRDSRIPPEASPIFDFKDLL
jgi:hypothetical protein